jgi:hypothetical protein
MRDRLWNADHSSLNDLERAELNKLRLAYESGGEEALRKAWNKLKKEDVLTFLQIQAALFPNEYGH